MKRFVEGMDRGQATLFPEYLEDWICEDNPVGAIGVFVDELDPQETLGRCRLSTIDTCSSKHYSTGPAALLAERISDKLAVALVQKRG